MYNLFLALAALPAAPQTVAPPAALPAPTPVVSEDDMFNVPGELVVSFKSAERPADLDALVSGWALQDVQAGFRTTSTKKLLQWRRRGEELLTTVLLVEYAPAAADIRGVLAALSAREEIEWAVPNTAYAGDPREIDPNDPQYGSQYHHPLMQNNSAWNITYGDSSIIIGVTDDGVDTDHVDLVQNIWVNPGEIPGDGIDNDGNGYVDDVNGYDFIFNNNDPNPNSSGNDHGTHCAGIAAARTDNGIGVAGTAGQATILPLQFYGSGGSWTASVIAETFAYAADNGAQIVTTSYNMDGWVGNQVVTAGYDYMYDNGVLHFNSAGNGSSANPPRQAFHQTMLVASTTSTDAKSGFSNWGTGVDLAAPGSSVLSTILNDQYGTKSGTSMAAPNAAGVAALIWSANPTWTRDQVAAQIWGTADNIDNINPQFAGGFGGGRVNSFRALTETLTPPKITVAEGLPEEGATLLQGQFAWSLRFDRILDPVTANDPNAVRLDYAGADGIFGTADDSSLSVDRSEYLIGSNVQSFSVPGVVSTGGLYRITVDAGILTDPFGQGIDGDGDGVGGDSFFRTFSLCDTIVLFEDNCESGVGWSVENVNLTAGAWTVPPEVPTGGGTRNDPPTDFDGSGRCFLTENGPGNTDVDGGPTRLISRAFDLSGTADPYLSFALWIDATRTDDTVQVHISDNGGASWTLVETYTRFGGWEQITLRVEDYVTPTADVRLRWSAQDGGTPSVLEAAVDYIRGFVPSCGGVALVGTEYCFAVPNSSGAGGRMRGEGSPIVADNLFTLVATDVPANQFGLFFAGAQQGGTVLGNGLLCIGGTLTRVTPVLLADPAGEVRTPIDLTFPTAAINAVPGATAYYQYWFRDPVAGGAQSNVTNGLQVNWL